MATNREVKKIGLVISGAFSIGVAELAFIKSLIEKIGYERISIISSASIGSINGYAVSCHQIDHVLDFYSNLDFDNAFDMLKSIRRGLFSEIFNQADGTKMTITTYSNVVKVLELEPHYYCLNSLSRPEIKACLKAGTGFPVIIGSKRFNKSLFWDGGSCDNIPVYPITYYDVDMILVIHCFPKYYPDESYLKPDRIFVDVDCTLPSKKHLTLFSCTKDDVREMLKIGTEYGKEFANEIFSDFTFDGVKKRCQEFTLKNVKKRKEKSGVSINSVVEIVNTLYKLKIGKI